MKKEFGPSLHGLKTPNLLYNDDTISQLSDCTSITSWGHNLLMENNINDNFSTIIKPTDSLSTKETLLFNNEKHYNNNNKINFYEDTNQTFNNDKKLIENNNNFTNLEINIHSNLTNKLSTDKKILNEAKEKLSLKMLSLHQKTNNQKQVSIIFIF